MGIVIAHADHGESIDDLILVEDETSTSTPGVLRPAIAPTPGILTPAIPPTPAPTPTPGILTPAIPPTPAPTPTPGILL